MLSSSFYVLLIPFSHQIYVHFWRDVLETVIIRRKLTDAQANPSTQRKRYLSPIWQITLNFIRQEQLYALLKIKEKKRILNQTHHTNRRMTNKLT